MRCPQPRPATISCWQTMAISKPSGGVAAGIGDAGIGGAGGAGERRRLNVPIINAHDQRPSAKYAGGRTVHLSGLGAQASPIRISLNMEPAAGLWKIRPPRRRPHRGPHGGSSYWPKTAPASALMSNAAAKSARV
jgi:hypothetical protein